MLHGFPESWYSWRHQFKPLANAGYKAVAPDMRGYGESDKPNDITAYNQVEVVNDIIGLIAALGYETAIVIGHDWGRAHRMEFVRFTIPTKSPPSALCPYPSRREAMFAPLAQMQKNVSKACFFYQLYFSRNRALLRLNLKRMHVFSLKKVFTTLASGDF